MGNETLDFPPNPSAREVIAAYLEAVRAGQAPDRQQLLARHPALAGELAAFFSSLGEAATLAGPAALAPRPPVSRWFGNYELLEEIARGGMGVVFRARQISPNRLVALKMILAGPLAAAADVDRFRSEAEAAGNLDHPNIVPIYEVGDHDGQPYFSMKLIEGGNLAQQLAARPHVPASRAEVRPAVELLAAVARAVHYAHQHGILHRDLKPANILLDGQGHPHVTDFGLAKRVEGESKLTQSGTILGTPSYMAPEQAGGKRGLSTAADVYSLGAILFEMLTGRPPFQAAGVMETLLQVLQEEPPRPRQLNPTVPRDLETICLKCLEKEAARRYGSAEALAEELERWLAWQPIRARRAGAVERVVKWAQRRPAIAALTALVVLVAALGVGGIVWKWRDAVAAEHAARLAEQEAEDRAAAEALARAEALAAQQREAGERRLAEEERKKSDQAKREAQTARAAEEKTRQKAEAERDDKDQALIRVKGLRLSAAGVTARPSDPGLGMLLAMEGVRRTPSIITWSTLLDAIAACREVSTLRGPSPAVGASFDPQGKRILVAARDVAAALWDPATKQFPIDSLGTYNALAAARLSPDGRRVLTLHQGYQLVEHPGGKKSLYTDRMAHVWDASTGKELARLRGHRYRIVGAEFSPDSKQVVTASHDGTARVFDAATGKTVAVLKKHQVSVARAFFSPGGERILTVTATQRYSNQYPDAEVNVSDPDLPAVGKSNGIQRRGHSEFNIGFMGESAIAVVWDARTHREVATLMKARPALFQFGHVWYPTAAAFRPDGKQVAIAFTDEVAGLWEVARGSYEQRLFKGHEGAIHAIGFSPDGKRLVTAGQDQTVRIWDPATGKELLVLRGHKDAVRHARFSRDGRRLLTASDDGTARLWDAATGGELAVLLGHGGPVLSAEFSPDERRAVTAGDTTVRVWDLAAPPRPEIVVPAHQASVAEPRIPIVDKPMPATSLAFGAGGAHLLSAGTDGTARLIDAATGRVLRKLGEGKELGEVRSAFFGSDGKQVVTASANSGATRNLFTINNSAVHVWDAHTGADRLSLGGHGVGALLARLSPDGTRLVTVTDGYTRRPSTGTVSLNWSLTLTQPAGIVRLWDARNGKLLLTLGGRLREHFVLAFSPDSRHLLLAPGGNASAFLLDAATGTQVRAFQAHAGALRGACFSPDGRRLVTWSEDRGANVWDTSTGLLLARFEGFDAPVVFAAFSNDGQLLITLAGRRAAVWKVATRELVASLKGHEDRLTRAVFSPDDKKVLTASLDRTAILWDVATGDLLAAFKGHTGAITEVAYSPDGSRVATGSLDGSARIWPVDLWPFVERRKPRELTAQERQHFEIEPIPPRRARPLTEPVTVRAIPAPGEKGPLAALVEAKPAGEAEAAAWWQKLSADGEPSRQDLLALRAKYPGTPAALAAAGRLRKLPSPLDRLDPAAIGPAARWPMQPPELVAMLGEHGHRHWGPVHAVAVRRDGKVVASGGQDALVRFWDAATLREGGTVRGTMLGFVGDGKVVATFLDGAVRFWDVSGARPVEQPARRVAIPVVPTLSPDGNYWAAALTNYGIVVTCVGGPNKGKRAVLRGHAGGISRLIFSADSKRLASGSQDATVRLWDLTVWPPRERGVLRGHKGPVHALAFSGHGKVLASAGADPVVRLWDLGGARVRPRGTVADAGTGRRALALSGDGKLLAVGGNRIVLWDLSQARANQRAVIGQGSVSALAFTPDSQALVVGSGDWGVRVWDLNGPGAPRERAPLVGHQKMIYAVEFGADGQTVASASEDSTRLWGLTARPLREQKVLPMGGWGVLPGPDGKRLATVSRDVLLWDLGGAGPPTSTRLLQHPGTDTALSGSADGRWLASGAAGGKLYIWDLRGKTPRRHAILEPKGGLAGGPALAFSADGRLLAAGVNQSGGEAVVLWEVTEQGVQERAVLADRARVLAFAPDGRTLAVGDLSRAVRLWDLASPLPRVRAVAVADELPQGRHVHALAFAPDGGRLAGAGCDGRVVLWDAGSGRKVGQWRFGGVLHALAFAADGRHLAVGNGNGCVGILRVEAAGGEKR